MAQRESPTSTFLPVGIGAGLTALAVGLAGSALHLGAPAMGGLELVGVAGVTFGLMHGLLAGKFQGYNRASELADQKRAELTEELEKARGERERLNEMRRALLSNITHEIRTPLNGILGMTRVMQSTPLSDLQREYLQSVVTSAEALSSLLADLTDFAKLEAGLIEPEPTGFRLREDLAVILKGMAVKAQDQGLELTWQVDSNVPDEIMGDRLRLRQLLVILVGNALKFTKEGSINARVSLDKMSGAGIFLRFSVQDTGPGIGPEKLSTILEEFGQADGSLTRSTGGVGLGLATATRLAQALGGKLEVETAEGKGSTFHATVRCSLSDKPLSTPDEGSGRITSFKARTLSILLAEDHPINQTVAVSLLESWGHRVRVAEDGEKALEAYQEAPYDLILMDLQMPNLDGLSAARRIRELEQGSGLRVPILALTAQASSIDIKECLLAGMDGHVAKPFTDRDMAEALARVTGRSRAGDPAPQAAAAPIVASPPKDEPEVLFDSDGLLRRVGGNQSVYRSVIETFVSRSEEMLVELESAVDRQDGPSTATLAHTLKGTVGNFGATRAVKILQDLEALGNKQELTGAAVPCLKLRTEVRALVEALTTELELEPK